MRVWILYVSGHLTDRYHDNGGAVVFAETEERARDLLWAEMERPKETPSDGPAGEALVKAFESAKVMDANGAEEGAYVFPDAGCC